MVRQSSNLPYACKLAKLSDDFFFKVGSSVTREHGQGSEDQDINLPQKLSNSFVEWSQKIKMFTTFQG